MNKEELKRMFEGSLNLSPEKDREILEAISGVSSMAYKLCGTMLVNCKDCAELTIAVRRVHEGLMYFQEALMQAAIQEVKER